MIIRGWGAAAIVAAVLFCTTSASAYPEHRDTFRSEVGISSLECETCHQNRGGGEGCASPPCFNRFGSDYFAELGSGTGVWSRVADLDSDGDGYTNRLEFGDEDGDDLSEHGVVSPAHVDQGDLDECVLGMVTCGGAAPYCRNTLTCSAAGRPSFECSASPVTAPARSFIDDPWNRAVSVGTNEWVEVDSYYGFNPNVPSGCALSEPSVWLRYQGACSGRLRAELRTERGVDPTPRVMGFYDLPVGGCTPDDAPEEVSCGTSTTGLSVSGPLVRVMGRIRGEMRLYCAPITTSCTTTPDPEDVADPDNLPSDAVACTRRNVSCEYAEPVIEGTHIVDAYTGVCGPAGGTWLSYTAGCTGRVFVESRFHWNADVNFEHRANLAVYRGACPSPGAASCGSARSSNRLDFMDPSRETVHQDIDAITGETVYIFVAGGGQERVTVSCEEYADPELCSHCDELADCNVDAASDTISCLCPEETAGDGLSRAHGGEGCARVPPNQECIDAGLFCAEEAYCVTVPGDPSCRCMPGYFGSGFTCIETNACESSRCDGHHQICIDNLKGFDCICETGYSRDPKVQDLSCVVICGDGHVGPGEFCDDGNYIDGDGCDAVCEIEFNHDCRTVGAVGISECRNTCGDGLIDENEALLCERTIAEICDCKAGPGRPGRFGWGGFCLLGVALLLSFRRVRRA